MPDRGLRQFLFVLEIFMKRALRSTGRPFDFGYGRELKTIPLDDLEGGLDQFAAADIGNRSESHLLILSALLKKPIDILAGGWECWPVGEKHGRPVNEATS
jgi:hypothetical protein